MKHFCTYFDRNYLYKGLAMYRSLERHLDQFCLSILCMDGDTYRILNLLGLEKAKLFTLEELEAGDEDLAKAKFTRTFKEYCWTLSPSLPLFILKRIPEASEVTYLDADLLFLSDPTPVFEEMGPKSILIISHGYSPRYLPLLPLSGVYNVAFMVFKNNDIGMGCLKWWRERCNEWCFCRMEDGKFGDQKYLDDWPERFGDVCVLSHKGANVAPWNIEGRKVHSADGKVFADADQILFFHYHGVHLRTPRIIELPRGSRVTKDEADLLYRPYARRLRESILEVAGVDSRFAPAYRPLTTRERLSGIFQRRFCAVG
jgi:hypothetical protein